MKVGSLFSGIGGFDLGLEKAGCTIRWQVEQDPFARKVLAARWPHVACADDVRTLFSPDVRVAESHDGWGRIDLLCGGFPCQDLSVAGRRTGLAGERSGLFYEFIRIAQITKPTYGFLENVPGLFSSGGGYDMATVLEGLRQCWPVVGYRVLDSRYWGVPQRRRRIFFIGGPSVERVEQILFESEGGGGDFTACEEARTDLAASFRSRSHRPGVNAPGRGGKDDMNVVVTALSTRHYFDRGDVTDNSKLVYAPGHAACLNPGHEAKHSYADDGGTLNIVAHTLRGEGFDGSEDGTGRGTPIIAATLNCSGQQGGFRSEPGEHVTIIKQGVRRLTPTECERLQGFPDGWTCLCQPLASYESNRCTCADGPRYKTLGNAVTVPVIEWIGRRLMEQLS